MNLREILAESDKIAESKGLLPAICFLDSSGKIFPDELAELRLKMFSFKKDYYYRRSRLDSNVMYNDSTLHLLERFNLKDKYPHEYINALNNKGNDYFDSGFHQKAFEYYYRCREFARSLKDTCLDGDQSYHLGMVCYRQRKFSDAITYFNLAFVETEFCHDDNDDKMPFYRRQELLNNIALSYTNMNGAGYNDSAKLYYLKALQFIDSGALVYKNAPAVARFVPVAKAVIWGNLAKIFILEQQLDSAEFYLVNSIDVNSKPGNDNQDAWYSRIKLADIYFRSGKKAQTDHLLREISDSLDTRVPADAAVGYWMLKYNIAKSNHNTSEALNCLERHDRIKDSLEKSALELRNTDYAQLMKEQETGYQIQLLKKDNQLSRMSLWITVGLSVIALIIVAMVYTFYRKSARNVITLMRLNKQVRTQKQQLTGALDELQHINEEKDRILRIVAHDLRTPIGGVIMIGNFMLDDETDKGKREELEMIVSAGQSLLALTGELLEFSDIHSKKTAQQREIINLADLARQVTGLLDYKAKEKKQQLLLLIANNPLLVEVHKEKINRVMSNLVTNAIKFSPSGSVIKVVIAARENSAVVDVIDEGIGIPARLVDRVFDAFTPARRQGTNGEKSFGLGLSICKSIIEAEGGQIKVESTEGHGSTFSFNIPVAG